MFVLACCIGMGDREKGIGWGDGIEVLFSLVRYEYDGTFLVP